MTDGNHIRASQLLDLFSDADRLRLIGRLVEGCGTVTQVAADLKMKPQAVARHVRRLEDAGLIRRDGSTGLLAFDIESLREQAADLRPDGADSFSGESEDDARLLRSFVVDEKLVHLPSQRSRWIVVLGWLAGRFELGREYPESQVNEILGAVHEDHALLRRQLVDEGYMARERGIYWRIGAADTGDLAARE